MALKRIIFFLNYRCGSAFFETLLGLPWGREVHQGNYDEATRLHREWEAAGRPPQLIGAKERCPIEDTFVYHHETLERYKEEKYFAWKMHHGNWWGELRSDKIPEPYSMGSISQWGKLELLQLMITMKEYDWRFTYLVRDGKDYIDSMRNFKGGIEEKYQREDPADFFKVLCKGWRNRTRIAIDAQKEFPNHYKIFKAEDMFEQGIDIMIELFEFVGLTYLPPKIDRRRPLFHSSYRNPERTPWTQEEEDIFYQIAGKEYQELYG